MGAEEQHRRLLFWERSLSECRPCRLCRKAMFAWHDVKGEHWELCKGCDQA